MDNETEDFFNFCNLFFALLCNSLINQGQCYIPESLLRDIDTNIGNEKFPWFLYVVQ